YWRRGEGSSSSGGSCATRHYRALGGGPTGVSVVRPMTMVLETKSLRSRRGQHSPRIGHPESIGGATHEPAKHRPCREAITDVAIRGRAAGSSGVRRGDHHDRPRRAELQPDDKRRPCRADHADDPDPSYHGRPEPVLIPSNAIARRPGGLDGPQTASPSGVLSWRVG